MNELVKSQVRVMTDEGKYCSFKSMYAVVLNAMISSENITEKHYFSALKKLGLIEKIGNSWSAPEDVREQMVNEDLPSLDIYRRRKDARGEKLYYSYGFNCFDEDAFIDSVLSPVIKELDVLEEILIGVDEVNALSKKVLKDAGLPVGSINPRQEIDKAVNKWEK